MMKNTCSFLLGLAAAVAVAWFANERAAAAGFGIGCLFTLLLTAAVALSSPARLLRTSGFLATVGNACQGPRRKSRLRICAAIDDAGAPPATPLEADLASALKNFGAGKAKARKAAQQAIAANPAGSFDQLFPVAVNAMRGTK